MLRASVAFRDGTLTLIAVESAESYPRRAGAHWQLAGIVEPVALVVCGAGEAYALDMAANAVDLAALRRAVPDLDAALAAGGAVKRSGGASV